MRNTWPEFTLRPGTVGSAGFTLRTRDKSQAYIVRGPVAGFIAQRRREKRSGCGNNAVTRRLGQALQHAAAKSAKPSFHAAFAERRGPRNELNALDLEAVG